ncbi:glycosyltransferase family 4 protein [Tritonibacter multivorans]
MVMIHDAQVFSQPDSYSARFRSWYKTAQPTLGRVAKRILTVSEHSRKELVRFRVAPADKIAVVPNGADHILRITPDQSILQRHKLVPDGFLLAIGSLAPHKNLPTIITAAQSLGDRSLPLVIAGGGDSTVFAKAGIQNSAGVKLLGRVSDAELRALYDSARGLLFPSLTEGFGLPPIEAMTCGCPVVASTGGAVPEVCSGAAYLLAPQDQAGWRGAMEELSANEAFAQRLRDAGRKRAADYTWAKAAQKLRSELVAVGALTQAKSRRHA